MQVLREPAIRALGVRVCGRTFRPEGYKSLGDFCETPSLSLLHSFRRIAPHSLSRISIQPLRPRAFSLGVAATFLDEVK